MPKLSSLERAARAGERRRAADRRSHPLRSLLVGHLNPRRRGPRRARDGSIVSTDLHEPKWLALAVLILLLSLCDALLTLTLLQHGALEENPLMAILVREGTSGFAAAKIGLTAAGVLLLTMVAKVRAFGRVPVGTLLYFVLAGYAALVGYELHLLRAIARS